jgi:hypothetical protein
VAQAASLVADDPSAKTPLSPLHKNIPLYRNSESAYMQDTPAHEKGRSYVVTNRGPGCHYFCQRHAAVRSHGLAALSVAPQASAHGKPAACET